MPTATAFTALGVGNGFTSCFNSFGQKYDITDFHEWVTLGGYKKGDTGGVSAAQIDTSRRRAMALYWNAYKLTGVAQSKRDRSFGTNYDQTITSTSMEDDYIYTFINTDGTIRTQGVEAPYLLPNSRVCGSVSSAVRCNKAVYVGGTNLSFTPRIYAMYEGSVDDYENFIGFGAGYLSAYNTNGWAFKSQSRVIPSAPVLTLDVNNHSVWASMLEAEPPADTLYLESTVEVSDIEVGEDGDLFPLVNLNYQSCNSLDAGSSPLGYALPTSVDKIDSYTY
jgi:hypothetical protein